MSLLDATSTLPTDWKYVSEGGATIVFSYSGPVSHEFSGTVIRLRKAANAAQKASAADDIEESDDPTIVFQRRVIERLVPAEFLPRLDSVKVDETWLRKLRDLHEDKRPAERRAKDGIDIRRRAAVLATDLVGGEGFAVEIKPKWGFLPSPAHLSPRSKPVKTTTCRFCMHAQLKSAEGKTASLGYCPLDLYSGDEARVTKALHALWDAWIGSSGGVNNLRVFVGGAMLRPSSHPSTLAPLAVQILGPGDRETANAELRGAFTAAVLPAVIQTPVLQQLSNLQRTLDALDIEGLSVLWSEAQAAANAQVELAPGAAPGQTLPVPPLGHGLDVPTMSDWDTFLDVYLTEHAKMDHEQPNIAKLRYYCLAYLLSASFKDCSIIIKIRSGHQPRVTVIDLDVKSVDKLHKWALLDAEIVKSYEGIGQRSVCVDRWATKTS